MVSHIHGMFMDLFLQVRAWAWSGSALLGSSMGPALQSLVSLHTGPPQAGGYWACCALRACSHFRVGAGVQGMLQAQSCIASCIATHTVL